MDPLLQAKKIHFVGIKGVAMCSLALYTKGAGVLVTGSDIEESFPTDSLLTKAKIMVMKNFSPDHMRKIKPNAVVYTGAHNGQDNSEVKEAIAMGIPVYPHGKALGIFMQSHRQISVAGSHGKTTTSSMIATIFAHCNLDPSWALGCGAIRGLGDSGHAGKGTFFIAEADEYVTDPLHDKTPRFLWQKPEILVVTNIDFDHPDVYKTIEEVQSAFKKLQEQQVGIKLTIINAQDKPSKLLAETANCISVGFSPNADFQITHMSQSSERTFFTLSQNGVFVGEFSLKVPGAHNVVNAIMAAVAANEVGISWQQIRAGLMQFEGSARRFEKIGTVRGAHIYDDYAHHPVEIRATLEAARSWFPGKRILAVFQPHTYSRTHALLNDFSNSFSAATRVLLTDIYASAREHDTLGISGKTLFEKTKMHHKDVYYANDKDAIFALLHSMAQKDDIIIFMGAGDIYHWSYEFVSNT